MTFETTLLVLAWGAIVVMALAMSGILRQLSVLETTLNLRLSGPHRGGAEGKLVRLPRMNLDTILEENRLTCLLFVEPSCGPCVSLLQRLPSLMDEYNDTVGLVVVPLAGRVTVNDARVRVSQEAAAVADWVHVTATPFGALIRPDGAVLRARPLGSLEAANAFLNETAEDKVST